jgi:hypothetical protein
MKKTTFISGALFSSLTILGILFKTLHWPGASLGLFIGLGGLSLIFIPFFTIYQYNKNN